MPDSISVPFTEAEVTKLFVFSVKLLRNGRIMHEDSCTTHPLNTAGLN